MCSELSYSLGTNKKLALKAELRQFTNRLDFVIIFCSTVLFIWAYATIRVP